MTRIGVLFLIILSGSCSDQNNNDHSPSDTSILVHDSSSLNNSIDFPVGEPIEFTDSILKFSTGTFPEAWDLNRNLRGNKQKVLIWQHCKNDRGREWKSCIVINEFTDSLGKPEYCISMEDTYEPPFEEWHTSWIDYAPDSTSQFGFNDLLLECYHHKPTKKEINQLFGRFKFEFSSERYLTLEAGLDVELWNSVLGFQPISFLPDNN
jgi:hypothetical protein